MYIYEAAQHTASCEPAASWGNEGGSSTVSASPRPCPICTFLTPVLGVHYQIAFFTRTLIIQCYRKFLISMTYLFS